MQGPHCDLACWYYEDSPGPVSLSPEPAVLRQPHLRLVARNLADDEAHLRRGGSKDRSPSSTMSLNLVAMYSSANALGTATTKASDSSPTAHTPSNRTRRLESSIRSATRSRTSSQMRVASWWGSYNIVSSS